MLRRSGQSAFAPDAFVFPGGTVDDEDFSHNSWDDGRVKAEFRAVIPGNLPASEPPVGPREARALVNAAVRELKEEANIRVEPAAIHLFSHWITPPTESRRYNTHFFIARADASHVGIADRIETHDERWLSPANALQLHREERLHLVYPTIKHLERLAAFRDIDSLLAFAMHKPIVTIMPDTAPHEGFVMPPSLEGAW